MRGIAPPRASGEVNVVTLRDGSRGLARDPDLRVLEGIPGRLFAGKGAGIRLTGLRRR